MSVPDIEWVTVDDAAALAGVSRRTMYYWIRAAERSTGLELVTKRCTEGKKKSGLRLVDLKVVAANAGADVWKSDEVAEIAGELAKLRAGQAGLVGVISRVARALGIDI